MIDSIGLLDKFIYNDIFKDDLHKIGSGLKNDGIFLYMRGQKRHHLPKIEILNSKG